MIVLRVGFNEELIPPNEFYDLNQIQQKVKNIFQINISTKTNLKLLQ